MILPDVKGKVLLDTRSGIISLDNFWVAGYQNPDPVVDSNPDHIHRLPEYPDHIVRSPNLVGI